MSGPFIWQSSDRSPAESSQELSTGLARALFHAGTCVFLDKWTDRRSFWPGPVLQMNISKNGDKMQGSTRDLLRVTQEAIDVYERQTCFQGIRNIMAEYTVRVIVPYEGVIQPAWRYAGNSGQRLHHAVVFFPDRMNPASTRRGAS